MQLPAKLETKNLILRPYKPSDWSAFLKFMLCDRVTNYLNFTAEQTTPMGARELFNLTLSSYATDDPLFALVIAQQNNYLFIGSCGFSTSDKQKTANVSMHFYLNIGVKDLPPKP